MTYPQEARVWGLRWWKNSRESQSGAHDFVLSNIQADEIAIHSHTSKCGRMWTSTHPSNLLGLISSNKGIFELIQENQKRKVYFDIDGSPDLKLESVLEVIRSQFPGANLQVSGYESEKRNSWHVILSNYYFSDMHSQRVIVAWILSLASQNLGFDKGVYNKNRIMKCINQSKLKSPLIQEYIMGSKTLSKHFILTDFDEDSTDAALLDLLSFVNRLSGTKYRLHCLR